MSKYYIAAGTRVDLAAAPGVAGLRDPQPIQWSEQYTRIPLQFEQPVVSDAQSVYFLHGEWLIRLSPSQLAAPEALVESHPI